MSPGRTQQQRRLGASAVAAFLLVLAAAPAGAAPRRDPQCDVLARILERFEWDLSRRTGRDGAGNPVVLFEQAIVDLLGRHLADRCVRLNELQVVGSHNSYHEQPAPNEFGLIRAFIGGLADGFEYTHPPLDEQFAAQGVRQIELDVFHDPDGGLYATPFMPDVVAQLGQPADPENDPDGRLLEPGIKVLHVQDVDYRSTCLTLARCLGRVKAWSDANPRHVPLLVLIEAKDEDVREMDPALEMLPFVVPLEFDAEALDAVDAEIRAVFPRSQLLTPDDVRGHRATLEDAVLWDGWPTLGEARGRVMFALDNGGRIRDAYTAGHPALRGRVMFVDAPVGAPEAAFVKLNDPLGSEARIRDLVARGYVVRTRADADTVEARSGSTVRRDVALASGAQWVSTDYPVPDPAFGTGYEVRVPGGGPAACNPVNAPRGCRAPALE